MRCLTILILSLVALISCGGDSSDIQLSTDPSVVAENSGLETLTYETDPNTGDTVLRVQPNINSKEDLLAYKEQKIEETKQILELTKDKSVETPYYPATITMKRPIPLSVIREMLGEHNPTVAKVLKDSADSIKYLPKVTLEKNTDVLVVSSVKFVSTTGEGQLRYETLSNTKEVSKLEVNLAKKEMELNGVENYQLIRGITSIVGGIHRDSVMKMQEDPRVFLADIGPSALYEGKASYASWKDIYKDVEKYNK